MPEEQAQILGHGPGEGCDFCDNLRVERGADEEDLEDAIAEREEYEGEDYAIGELDSVAETETETETLYSRDGDDGYSESLLRSYPDDSETVRAMREESIITQYRTPQPPSSSSTFSSSRLSTSSSSTSTLKNMKKTSVYGSDSTSHHVSARGRERENGYGRGEYGVNDRVGYGYSGEGKREVGGGVHRDEEEEEEGGGRRMERKRASGDEGEGRKKRASEWARSYRDLVERM